MDFSLESIRKGVEQNKAIRRSARKQEQYDEEESMKEYLEEAELLVTRLSSHNVPTRRILSHGAVSDLNTTKKMLQITDGSNVAVNEVGNESGVKPIPLQRMIVDDKPIPMRRNATEYRAPTSTSFNLEMSVLSSKPIEVAKSKDNYKAITKSVEASTMETALEGEEDDFDEDVNPNVIISNRMGSWIGGVLDTVKAHDTSDKNSGRASVGDGSIVRARASSLYELDEAMNNRFQFMCLEYFMESLEQIISTPIVYLSKTLDPASLNLALEYITSNELTNNILIVHFVDDRKYIKTHQQIISRVQDFTNMTDEQYDDYHSRLILQSFAAQSNDSGNKHDLKAFMANLSPEMHMLATIVSLFDTLYT